MVINENIINKAVKESIDNFLISEGFWNGVYQIANVLSNGEWNKKHGYYPSYKQNNSYFGQLREYSMLSRWMAFHREQIWNKLHGDRSYIDNNYKYGYKYNQYDDYDYAELAKNYIEFNITERNLVVYMNQMFSDWKINQDNKDYIAILRNNKNNPEMVMRLLNMGYYRKRIYNGKGKKQADSIRGAANTSSQRQNNAQQQQQQPQNQSGQQQQSNRYYKGPLDNPKINNKY